MFVLSDNLNKLTIVLIFIEFVTRNNIITKSPSNDGHFDPNFVLKIYKTIEFYGENKIILSRFYLKLFR